MCDGLKNYPHYAPIKSLQFISRSSSGISQIGCLDEEGVISVWSISEIQSYMVTEGDINLTMGAKFKMSLNYSDNLTEYNNVVDIFREDDLTQSIETEYDPVEPQICFFSTSNGLFKIDRR